MRTSPAVKVTRPSLGDSPLLGRADFEALESLRGIAAGYVVLNHARGWLWGGGKLLGNQLSAVDKIGLVFNQLTRLGHEAVIVFFVLSGFSIAHSVSRAPSATTFWWRRIVRLYPPKVVALAWALLAFVLTQRITPDFFSGVYPVPPFSSLRASLDFTTPLTIAQNLLYMPRGAIVPQFWSLPHEMVFYLMAPLLVPRRRVFFAVAAGGWIAGLMLSSSAAPSFWAEYAFHYLLYFAVGVLAYRVFAPVRRIVLGAPRWLAGIGLTVSFGIMVLLGVRSPDGRVGECIAVAVAVAAIPICIEAQGGSRALRWLGRQSYTLYLTHVATIALVLAALHRMGMPMPVHSPWIWPIALLPCLAISTLLYHAVEARTRTWLDRSRQ